MENTELLKRARASESDRDVVQGVWDSIRRFVIPYRGNFFEEYANEGSIDWYQARHNFDSTASAAHSQLAASLHANITSPSLQWFLLRFRDEKLNKNTQAAGWLQDASQAVYYALQDSAFNLEIDECYQDLSGFGTGFMTLEEDKTAGRWDGLDFTSVPLKEGYFEQDHKGRVLRFYRKLRWTAGQIVSKFGSTGLPESILKAEEKGSKEKHIVWFCIYPRKGKNIRQDAPMNEKLSQGKRPWGFKYLLDSDASMLGSEGGYYDMPVYAPRWRKTSDSIWGNSPAHLVLGDIMSLNRAAEIHEVIAAKMADPPIMAEERSLIGDLSTKDGSLMVVRKLNGIAPFPLANRPEVLFERMQALQESIRTHFFSDQLQFPAPQGTPMSATEAQIRYEQLQKLLGPTLGRIQNDLLTPIVTRAFKMMVREGQIPPPPDIVAEHQGEIDLRYLGPLARSQMMDDLGAKERYVGFAANAAAVFPEAIDVVNIDDVMRSVALDLSIPASSINSEAEATKIRAERKEREEAMQQAMIAEQQGKAAQAVGAGQEAGPEE